MMLVSKCRVFVYEVKMMWWEYWVRSMCLCMKWGWCDAVIEWDACVCVWSDDDVMMLLSECHVFVHEVRMMWWEYWVRSMCLCMKWGWCDDAVEWVSCVCVLSEDDVMLLLTECLVFVYDVKMSGWWCCWVSVMCLSMKWGWCDAVEWVSCVWVWSEDELLMKLLTECLVDDVITLLSKCHAFVDDVITLLSVYHVFAYEVKRCNEIVEWVSYVCVWREDVV